MFLNPGTFVAVVSIILVLFSGCAEDSIFAFNDNSATNITCPEVAILEAPSQLTRFADGGIGEISGVIFQAKMGLASFFCEIENNAVVITLDTLLNVKKGPSMTNNTANFTYFVAILNGHREIILREAFPIVMQFMTDEPRIEYVDSVSLQIDFKKGEDPGKFVVYAGFEMTPDELKFSRAWSR